MHMFNMLIVKRLYLLERQLYGNTLRNVSQIQSSMVCSVQAVRQMKVRE
jgi:hypothetical protein